MLASPPVKAITQTIVDHFAPRRIVMFGSRARGEAGPDSDLDLMVVVDRAPERDLSPVRRAIAIAKVFGVRPWALDLVVYTPEEIERLRRQPGSLPSIIDAEGKVLYERDA